MSEWISPLESRKYCHSHVFVDMFSLAVFMIGFWRAFLYQICMSLKSFWKISWNETLVLKDSLNRNAEFLTRRESFHFACSSTMTHADTLPHSPDTCAHTRKAGFTGQRYLESSLLRVSNATGKTRGGKSALKLWRNHTIWGIGPDFLSII